MFLFADREHLWATPSENRKNQLGQMAREMEINRGQD